MKQLNGRLAVLTGGGTGMGRELTIQLVAAGCTVAICDVSQAAMDETKHLAELGATAGATVSTFVADVSDEAQMIAFSDHVRAAHSTDQINLLFNNAGIGGGGSMIADGREEWDKVFGVCWGGVYFGTRTFLPMLVASDEGHIVNTSSVNGFWACLGGLAHSAYSSAKFAVKGFTESLIVDLRANAPHVRASVVMPGHIGTSIIFNSGEYFGRNPKDLDHEQLAMMRARVGRQMGIDLSGVSDEDIRAGVVAQASSFRDDAPMSATEAATVILDGVQANEWRILVGTDAVLLDAMVRETPEEAYEPSFMTRVREHGAFGFIPGE
jgi:NAD(P)-dependent dehydrogenase (short-subunit alcohol dehydrogenase family)